MPKFRVHDLATVSYCIGEYEAKNKEEAEQMAIDNPQNKAPILCHHCSSKLDVGDWYKTEVDEVEDD